MKKRLKLMIAVVVSALFIYLLIYSSGILGVTASKLEQDARSSQHIDKSWSVEKAVSDNIGAMIFYGEQSDESVFSIYLNRNGFSFGYFFYAGGSAGAIADGVAEFTYLDYGSSLLSMNRDKVEKIVFGNKDIAPILVDPTKPFAVILPDNCESFDLYDINGKSIPITVYAN
jgi:hypothetical protein